MKNNGKRVLFISITIFALILCLFYLSQIYLSTNSVETFESSKQYYIKKLPYVNNKVTAPTIYNQDVLNHNLPIVYDVDPKNVNLCYGDNKNENSLYTFPYIILILRLYYLTSNSDNTSDEYKDLCTVLRSINTSSSGTNGPIIITNNGTVNNDNLVAIYSYIIKNSTNINSLLNPPSNIGKLYGTNLIKSCSRLYPNWLINPTNPNNSLQIKLQQFPYINNGNGNQFADLYVNGIIPGGTSLFTSSSKNAVREVVISSTNPPLLSSTDPKNLPEGAKNTTYHLDKFNFQNKNNEYCTRDTANKDPTYQSIEWTNEFSLQNNISDSVEDKDICLKLLLNPLTGDIVKCTFVQFNSKTLTFDPIDDKTQKYIYTNMVELYDTTTNFSSNENQKTWGFKPTPFKFAKLEKYVFDDCGRLYSVSKPVSGEYKFPGTFDLTQIFASKDLSKDLYSIIRTYSDIVSRKPVPTYNIINTSQIESITVLLIDNTITIHDFYTRILYDNFTSSLFERLGIDTLNGNDNKNKSNVNGTFSDYFMKSSSENDKYSNITNYTASDGFVYINLGNIPGKINPDGKSYSSTIDTAILKHIKTGIITELLKSIQKLLMSQILENSTIINNNIAILRDLQTAAYNTINTIYYYLRGSGTQPGIIGYLAISPIPLLTNIQKSSLDDISGTDGRTTNSVTVDTYKTAQDMLNNYRNTNNNVNIDPNGYLNNILNLFGNLLGSTALNPKSLFGQYNITTLVSCISKLEQIYDYTNINKPNNLNTAHKYVSSIHKGLTSLIQFKNYMIGIDTSVLFTDQSNIQNWYNYYMWAQWKYGVDWDNFQANGGWGQQQRGYGWWGTRWSWWWWGGRWWWAGDGGGGRQRTGNTLNFGNPPTQGESLSSVLNNIAKAASIKIPGLASTTTTAASLEINLQNINDSIRNMRIESDTTMNTVTELGKNITSIYYS